MMIAFFLFIIVINMVSYLLYRNDKMRAERDDYRIPEVVLLTVAFIGGALGAFCAMMEYRHKTLHKPFAIGVPIALLIQTALVVWAMVHCLLAT